MAGARIRASSETAAAKAALSQNSADACAWLRAQGFVTRAALIDLSLPELQGVHGIGPGRAAILLEWAAKARSDSP
jgi:hypothetical protein